MKKKTCHHWRDAVGEQKTQLGFSDLFGCEGLAFEERQLRIIRRVVEIENWLVGVCHRFSIRHDATFSNTYTLEHCISPH